MSQYLLIQALGILNLTYQQDLNSKLQVHIDTKSAIERVNNLIGRCIRFVYFEGHLKWKYVLINVNDACVFQQLK